MKWTDAQRDAIYEPSGEGAILVSAGAGSGKTAVLVERIAQMITRKTDRVSVEELLVVTFTDAAAAEMRDRIARRINEEYKKKLSEGDAAEAKYLRSQMHLTASADINTIDSFCLNVVRNNFHVLGVDPNFTIMDGNESDMLADDALSELFAELYASEDPVRARFESLVGIYASNRDDEGLKKVIRKVYGFIQTFPSPSDWLREKADMYGEDMTKSGWMNDVILKRCRERIVRRHEEFWRGLYDEMLGIVKRKYKTVADENGDIKEASEYWGKIWNNVRKCLEAVRALKAVDDYDGVYGVYKKYIEKKSYLGTAINTIPSDIKASDEEWRHFYDEYNYMRDALRRDCMTLPTKDKDEFNAYVHADELKAHADDIVWLTELFSERFEEKKNKKNEKTFSDIEHLAYRLFRDNENIRGEYAERYREILIDEYQDTNGLQDAIFSSISRGGKNIFMVGDLKQSIYRFRGGDPTIFKNKSRAFENDGGTKITLAENFRSRREVIDGINSVFGAVMSEDVGEADYRGEELRGASDMTDGVSDCDYSPEFMNISVFSEDSAEIGADKAEAICIAERIRDLTDGHFKIRDAEGKYRDLEYRDVVILVRSVKGGGEMIRETLEERSIPVFVQKEEYFERREIKLMLSLISLINNHLQDIPLAAVMRSPIGGFTENELAMIKTECGGVSFYKAVKKYASLTGDGGVKEKRLRSKCRCFTANLDRWRGYVKTKPIAQLIWTLYEETGFYDFMGALEGGEEAQANLKLLYERAKRYEESGFKGIFNFIRYIERMENRHDDISGARLVNENHNVVRIMTIHKSKGLEFPVVFLARTAKRFNATVPGEETRVRLHNDLGIGIDYYNYEDMYCKKLMFNSHIADESDRERRSEEMRLMYVAMTRAKEKLIVTLSRAYRDEDDYTSKTEAFVQKCSSRTLVRRAAEEAVCYGDWISSALALNGGKWTRLERTVSPQPEDEEGKDGAEEIIVENEDELRRQVRTILEFNYAYPMSGAIPAKTSVTAIKEMQDEENSLRENPIYMARLPEFADGAPSGAQIGTAHHQIMAYIDLDKMRHTDAADYDAVVRDEAKRIAGEGQIDKKIAADEKLTDMICENVSAFFKSDMGKRVLTARRVYRERPFEIEIGAREYDASLDEVYDGEMIMVQGIIDLYFEDENGDVTLVDYKTDRCRSEDEKEKIARRYERQIDLYGRAMEKILKKSVKDKYLYLFSAGSVVKLN